jgi:RNA exonuclease 1
MSAINDTEFVDSASHASDSGSSGKKRKLEEEVGDTIAKVGMDLPLSLPEQPKLPEFNLTSARPASQDKESPQDVERPSSPNWQTVERPRKKAKKIPKTDSRNYPAIEFSSESRLQTQVKLNDLQSLVLYILADGPSPQFVSVRHRPQIRKVVVLMIPGLEMDMFYEAKKEDQNEEERKESRRERERRERNYTPDDYYPKRLKTERLSTSLQPWADMFEHVWPIKTPGDDKFGRMHSPLHAMLTAPAPKTKEEKEWKKNRKGVTPAKEPQGWKNNRVPIPEFIHSVEVLQENEYTIHPALYTDQEDKAALAEHRRSKDVSQEQGWVDTNVKHIDEGTPPDSEIESGSITAGREVIAMDCEMCMTGEAEFSLTRISLVGWDGTVIMDELVKPAKPITNYVTQYVFVSGF